ncbi:MAG: hypothetical protein OEX00_09850 [Gammaproteobacteria bacterium]|nr:hypothetical protein [Gammaproteobacteria bacterium]
MFVFIPWWQEIKMVQEIMARRRRTIKWFQWMVCWAALWFTLGAGGMPAVAQDDVSDAEIARRIAFIEGKLDDRKGHTEIWHGTWSVINGGATVGLAIAAGLSSSSDNRINYATQSVVALIGVADLYFFRPIPGLDGAQPIHTLPDATPEERREKLAKAEAMLRASAAREEERTGWSYHAGNVAVNGLAGTVIGVFGDTKDGIVAGSFGFLGGLAYAFTEPWGRKQDLRDYERLRAGLPLAKPGGWAVKYAGNGLMVRYSF